MTLDEYQQLAKRTAVFPQHMGIVYCSLALCGEAGEVAEKVKKVIRDENGNFMQDHVVEKIAHELGDVFWYLANLANQIGYSLEDIAQMNLEKLQSRAKRGTLQGSGDDR